ALVAPGEPLDDGDRAREVLDRPRVRREPHRPLPGAVEAVHRPLADPGSGFARGAPCVLVLETELDPVAIGPLEVVAKEAVELDNASAVLVQPVGEPLVELRPH